MPQPSQSEGLEWKIAISKKAARTKVRAAPSSGHVYCFPHPCPSVTEVSTCADDEIVRL